MPVAVVVGFAGNPYPVARALLVGQAEVRRKVSAVAHELINEHILLGGGQRGEVPAQHLAEGLCFHPGVYPFVDLVIVLRPVRRRINGGLGRRFVVPQLLGGEALKHLRDLLGGVLKIAQRLENFVRLLLLPDVREVRRPFIFLQLPNAFAHFRYARRAVRIGRNRFNPGLGLRVVARLRQGVRRGVQFPVRDRSP
jgi:hypothetical protein